MANIAPHRVPYLQLDLLSINVDHACAKLHADGEVVHRLEALVCELQQQARLPHACSVTTVSICVGTTRWQTGVRQLQDRKAHQCRR